MSFYPERIQGIARFAKSHGWHLTIVDRLARFPRGWRGDGALVTLRGNEETNRFVRGLVRDGIPVVDLTFNHPEIKLPRVSGDHEAFGRLARQHFESLNFRHFAWFSTSWSHVHALRFTGFSNPNNPNNSNNPNNQTILLPPRGIVVRRSTDTLAADDPLLSAALHEIEKRLSTSFGIAELADALNVSRTRLDKLFASTFARPVGKEIMRQRIECAKKLLAESDRPLKQIADSCGFCNAGYFTNAFRDATGLTPKAWRKKH